MRSAHNVLKDAGVWSPAEVVTAQPDVPKIETLLVGTFAAGDRHRVLYSILADGIEIGTAVHWTGKVIWPWGLNIPAACIVNFGFRDRPSLLRAVDRYVRTGEI